VKVLGIDIDSIANKCAEQIAQHRHEMSSPEIEETLKEIAFHLDRLATILEERKP
jgi:hypothetical protein